MGFKYGIFSDECFVEFFEHHNFFHVECLKLTISKLLSFGIIFGSLGYKLPQIFKISAARDAEGISPLAVLLEILGCTISLSYSFNSGFPILTYGESFSVAFFDFFIMYQILTYNRGGVGIGSIAALVTYLMVVTSLLNGFVPLSALAVLQGCVTPLTIVSRVPQIYQNMRDGNTGQLSLITWGLNGAGSLARVFTTLAEVRDPLILSGFVCAAFLNLVVVAQIFYYWGATQKALAAAKSKASKKGAAPSTKRAGATKKEL
eukprot:TRINITY_DN1796_c1_g1_i1.p1 TRINITY_DN1796_c1_g1~~TRINITY_DN1796_c1_g1_i1.p1  ORF type:complete len:273 (-),score=49.08 TRINITY_DN1796_c1_g1_i1:140-922(-)